MIGQIHYLNSGDWIESLTAIVEHYDGRFELIDYPTFLRDHPMPAEEPTLDTAEPVDA
jgi:hypothetical protein